MRAHVLTRCRRVALALGLAGSAAVVTARGQVPPPLAQPTAADLASGAKVFEVYCARCHGMDGSGGSGPPLTRPRLRRAADEAGVIAIVSEGVPGTSMMGAWSLSEIETQQVAAYVRSLGQRPPETLTGDADSGRRVYDSAGCAACHILEGGGTAFGPDLTDVGVLRGTAYLRESLINPAAARPERPLPYEPYGYPAYVQVRARPRRGDEVVGVRVNEDTFTIQLRDKTGRLVSFRKADLQQLAFEPETSVMPSYRGQLDDTQLNDLVAYLMTRTGRP
ncbi:Cytochrome c oxidase subunit III [Luteitalea pratensis]|uniref:Cytochrome c oxidase subunit III n=1 Tax=Luteitalea pratensis TaxID=1855912 RepID=A0A143PES3_LUTPR|nr:c-type cytochrome [Luteitalea pratensis]AMY07072.1 Cytochrome c oxidase subunit III [Luteitalea pratensis]